MHTKINYITLALVVVLLALVAYQQTLLADIQFTVGYNADTVHAIATETIPYWCGGIPLEDLNR